MKYMVLSGDSYGRVHPWFARFLIDGITEQDRYDIQTALDRHNANAYVPAGEQFVVGNGIWFNSEEDFLIFKLKWS